MLPRERLEQMIRQKGRGWVLLNTFFVVGQVGCYRQAAPTLGLHDTTGVKKRVRCLERLLDLALVIADSSGIMLTEGGQALFVFLEGEWGASARTDG